MKNEDMKLKACDKCNVYLRPDKLRLIWIESKQKHLWLCKSCAADMCVSAEDYNSFDD